MSHLFIHFLCVWGFLFFFFRGPAGQRRPIHSTPQSCSQDRESARGGGFWVGAEQKIKRRMIDIIYRLRGAHRHKQATDGPVKGGQSEEGRKRDECWRD